MNKLVNNLILEMVFFMNKIYWAGFLLKGKLLIIYLKIEWLINELVTHFCVQGLGF